MRAASSREACIILWTWGRKSGAVRKTPLMRVREGERYAVVASMGGAPSHPVWYRNLVADPHVSVQDGAELKDYVAHEATGDEKARWWRIATPARLPTTSYQVSTEREIRSSSWAPSPTDVATRPPPRPRTRSWPGPGAPVAPSARAGTRQMPRTSSTCRGGLGATVVIRVPGDTSTREPPKSRPGTWQRPTTPTTRPSTPPPPRRGRRQLRIFGGRWNRPRRWARLATTMESPVGVLLRDGETVAGRRRRRASSPTGWSTADGLGWSAATSAAGTVVDG